MKDELMLVCDCGNLYPISKVKTDILNTFCDECDKKVEVKND